MISEKQYGFMPGKITADVMFALLLESIEKVRRSCTVSFSYSQEKKKYVRIVQDI